MAEVLGFEERVEGLTRYYEALRSMDPHDPDHSELADPRFFHGTGFEASEGIYNAKAGVLFDMACHARREYGARGYDRLDLWEETPEQRAGRADVLAVMTSPIGAEARADRAARILGFLKSVISGQELEIEAFNADSVCIPAQRISVEGGRSLFAVFRNGHLSSRVLTIQYDTPERGPATTGLGVHVGLIAARNFAAQQPTASA
jgi:hypothetical protein